MFMVNHLVGFGAGGQQADGSFYGDLVALGLTTNLQVALDAGSSDSYSSGQKWLDLTANGYDFTLGTNTGSSTDDPTFNGSAGGLSSSEYFSVDGGDYFEYDAANETWMENIHKNNAAFTLAFWVYRSADGELAGTQAGSNTGFFYILDGSSLPRFAVENSTASVLDVTADTVVNNAAWNFVAISIDEATGAGGGFHYLNGSYNQVAAANTFNATYSSPAAGAASGVLNIFARGNGSSPTGSGNRIAGAMMWEGTALSKANLDSIWNRQKTRFGL